MKSFCRFSGSGVALLVLLQLHLVWSGNLVFPSMDRQTKMSSVGEVWPRPQKQELKNEYVGVLDTFYFQVKGKTCDILKDAIARYTTILSTSWRHMTKFDLVNSAPNIVGKTDKLKIKLLNECEQYPHLDMDEKYILEIKDGSSVLESQSIWGILRGLETFSQLSFPAANGELLIIQVQKIEDFPQFSHRGLLIDTARHYLPVKTIKKQLDIMSYNKMNVLHWHIVDDQSFPYESKKFPALSEKGAFGPDAVYTEDMIKEVVAHGRLRGIRIIPEFDTPGHTDSMEAGHPENHCHCPNNGKSYVGPMDPTKNSTLEFVKDLFTEVKERFPDSYVHLGGDEVEYYCWTENAEIRNFMAAKNWSGPQLQSYYMQNVMKDVKSLSRNAIVWEEVFTNWQNLNGGQRFQEVEGSKGSISMDKDTIVNVWKGEDPYQAKTVVKAGYKVINSAGWYLDHLDRNFEEFARVNFENLSLTAEEKKLILGGEASMWGENVDESNIESRVWPRACALAETLWSAPHNENQTARITEHVCRMRRRNVQAAPAHDISYCTPVLARPSKYGDSRPFYSISRWKDTFNLNGNDDQDDLKYETVKAVEEKPIEEKPKTSEKIISSPPTAVVKPVPTSDGKSTGDAAPVTQVKDGPAPDAVPDNKSGASLQVDSSTDEITYDENSSLLRVEKLNDVPDPTSSPVTDENAMIGSKTNDEFVAETDKIKNTIIESAENDEFVTETDKIKNTIIESAQNDEFVAETDKKTIIGSTTNDEFVLKNGEKTLIGPEIVPETDETITTGSKLNDKTIIESGLRNKLEPQIDEKKIHDSEQNDIAASDVPVTVLFNARAGKIIIDVTSAVEDEKEKYSNSGVSFSGMASPQSDEPWTGLIQRKITEVVQFITKIGAELYDRVHQILLKI